MVEDKSALTYVWLVAVGESVSIRLDMRLVRERQANIDRLSGPNDVPLPSWECEHTGADPYITRNMTSVMS